jgi:hypothetical protein
MNDGLAPMRGLLFGLVFGLVLWVLIIAGIVWIVR